MFDQLLPANAAEPVVISWTTLGARLAAALVFGGCVSLVYRLSHGRTDERATAMSTTLILLAGLIAMVSIVIGSSVARAFSLVGALSIVRFRTVVEDTRDTAFVIFAVVVGMAAGDGQWSVAMIGTPLLGIVAILLNRVLPNGPRPATWLVTLRVGLGRDPAALVQPVFSRVLPDAKVLAAGTAKQGAAVELTYRGTLAAGAAATDLVRDLNQIDGVMSVEARLA